MELKKLEPEIKFKKWYMGTILKQLKMLCQLHSVPFVIYE